jgi:hypothetical protein
MAHFVRQNEPFCAAKKAIFKRKMSHFESSKNVKKIQVACCQLFKTLSYFARTRPSDFYFRTMALSEGKNEIFVRSFHKKTDCQWAAGDMIFKWFYMGIF